MGCVILWWNARRVADREARRAMGVWALTTRVLVTGAAGFIGGAWARHATARGADLVAVDRAGPVGALTHIVDLRDARAVASLFARTRPEVVVHAAAMLPVARDDRAVWASNVGGTRAVLDACRACGVRRVVFLSTSTVYALDGAPWRDESAPLDPRSPYGRSKREAERACEAAVDAGLSVAWLRLVPVIGPGRGGLFHHLCAWVREGRRVPMLGDGSNRVQLVHVDDVCAAIDALLDARETGAFNCGASSVASVRDELTTLCDTAGRGARVMALPAAPVERALVAMHRLGVTPTHPWMVCAASREMTFSVARLAALGWSPRYRSAEALVDTYRAFDPARRDAPEGTHRAPWPSALLDLLRRAS